MIKLNKELYLEIKKIHKANGLFDTFQDDKYLIQIDERLSFKKTIEVLFHEIINYLYEKGKVNRNVNDERLAKQVERITEKALTYILKRYFK
ncbi:MAG TPA: hypothetical protein PKV21_09450 [bacterium]|nr:hypothetical protein [bacterium]